MLLTERGLLVDEELRLKRIEALEEKRAPIQAEAEPLVPPLREKLERPNLFWKPRTCKGCRNGCKKRLSCEECKGVGKFEDFAFNLGSEAQVKDVLYHGLKLPQRSREGSVTSDEEALKSLLSFDKIGFVKLALEYAKLTTMREIYERLEPGSDGRVRAVFNPAGTLTGRLNSRGAFYVPGSTNLQNLPAFTATQPLYRVRECIVAPPGMHFFNFDLSQAEARVTACLCHDTELLARWEVMGWDVHRWTAAHIFRKEESDITPTERYLGKVARHALNYGMGYVRFWRHVNESSDLTGIAISQAEARRIREAYHMLHPKLYQWWRGVEKELLWERPLTTAFGRRCHFQARVEAGQVDADTLQTAIAYEPQSTVADWLNRGMLCLFERENAGFRVVHQVHDSLLLEVKEGAEGEAVQAARECLEFSVKVRDYELLIPVDVEVGRNWGEMGEWHE